MEAVEWIKLLQIIFACITCFSLGMSFDVSNKSREISKLVWSISLAIVWILNV